MKWILKVTITLTKAFSKLSKNLTESLNCVPDSYLDLFQKKMLEEGSLSMTIQLAHHSLYFESGEQRPRIEPSLILISIRPHCDAIGVQPRKFVLQSFCTQKLNFGTTFPKNGFLKQCSFSKVSKRGTTMLVWILINCDSPTFLDHSLGLLENKFT